VQESRSQTGVLAFLPLFEDDAATVDQRRRLLKGYGVGVLRVGDLLVSALEGVDPDGIYARLYDHDPKSGKKFLAGYGGGSGLWNVETSIDQETPWRSSLTL